MDAMVPLIADELIAKLAKQNPETFKAQMDAITSQLLEEMNFVKQNPEVFKTRIEIILTHLLGGIEQKKPHSRQSAPTRTAFKKHIDSASSDSDDLTPINFDDILNDLPVDDDLTPINFDDIQFDDDLPERRFDVGRDKENDIYLLESWATVGHIVEGFKYLASVLRILWSSRGWRCWRSGSHPFSALLLQLVHLLEDHLLIPGIAHCLNTVLL